MASQDAVNLIINLFIYFKTTTTQCKLPECKSGICASGWKEKRHRRKLQWVKLLMLSLAATYRDCAFPLDVGTKTPLVPAVISPIATCTGGVYPSTHWRRYRTYTRVTCTVWWWVLAAVVVVPKGNGVGKCIGTV